jgi:gas vesicle protein
MMKLGWLVGAGLLIGCATASPPPQQTTAQSTQSAQGTQNKNGTQVATAKKTQKKELICESYKMTGSHIRKEVCRTKEQIAADRAQAEKLLREADRARPAEGQ